MEFKKTDPEVLNWQYFSIGNRQTPVSTWPSKVAKKRLYLTLANKSKILSREREMGKYYTQF